MLKYRTNSLPTRAKFASRVARGMDKSELNKRAFEDGICMNCKQGEDTLDHIIDTCVYFRLDRNRIFEKLEEIRQGLGVMLTTKLAIVLQGGITVTEVEDQVSYTNTQKEDKQAAKDLLRATLMVWKAAEHMWSLSRSKNVEHYRQVKVQMRKEQKEKDRGGKRQRQRQNKAKAEEMKKNEETMKEMREFLKHQHEDMQLNAWKDPVKKRKLMKRAGDSKSTQQGNKKKRSIPKRKKQEEKSNQQSKQKPKKQKTDTHKHKNKRKECETKEPERRSKRQKKPQISSNNMRNSKTSLRKGKKKSINKEYRRRRRRRRTGKYLKLKVVVVVVVVFLPLPPLPSPSN